MSGPVPIGQRIADLGAERGEAAAVISGNASISIVASVACWKLGAVPPELVERHGIDYAEVRPVVDALGRGEVERALELTTPEIGERLSIAGEPMEWIERLRSEFTADGYNHVALGLVAFPA